MASLEPFTRKSVTERLRLLLVRLDEFRTKTNLHRGSIQLWKASHGGDDRNDDRFKKLDDWDYTARWYGDLLRDKDCELATYDDSETQTWYVMAMTTESILNKLEENLQQMLDTPL